MIDFYGVFTDIIELDYLKDKTIVLFECEWFDLSNGKVSVHVDGNSMSVNVSCIWCENDFYVLVCQVKQIFYVLDTQLGKNWQVMQKI